MEIEFTVNYIIDTNIVSLLLKKDRIIIEKLMTVLREGHQVFISIITHYETKRGLMAINAVTKMDDFEKYCDLFDILWLDDLNFSEKASGIYVNLRKRGELIQDADIWIAATALVHNLIVVTNDKHFARIPHLKIENWLQDSFQ